MKVSHLPHDPGPAAWDSILPQGPHYPKLEGAQTTDWLIIGAGFAGLAAARRLRQLHPTDIITLLDARAIAEGPVGRNSGFMIDLPHNLVSEDYAGALDKDRAEAGQNRDAISFVAAAAQDYGFTPETFVRSGKVNAAATQKGTRHNHDYAAHLKKMGEAHELLDATQMQGLCGSGYYHSGLYTPGTAMLQPALFAREMASGLAADGVQIFEGSPVTDLSRGASTWTATTPDGRLETPKIILTVNGHVESFGFFRRRLMHIFLYASMTRPLDSSEQRLLGGESVWGFTPADPMGTTVRKINGIGGTRIVIRNRVTWDPSRKAGADAVSEMGRSHSRSFHARFPMLANVEMAYRWGGLLCLSRNGSSAFGEVEPGLYAAGCQNGLGAARGTYSGMMVAELAGGGSSDALAEFAAQPMPSRLPPRPIASLGAKAVLRWGEIKARREL